MEVYFFIFMISIYVFVVGNLERSCPYQLRSSYCLLMQKAMLIVKFIKQLLGSVIGGAVFGISHGLPTPTATKVILIILI